MLLSDIISSKANLMKLEKENIKAEEVRQLLLPLNYYTVLIKGDDAPNKKTLLKIMADSFKFPAYFGYNWDALSDCMRSLPDFTKEEKHALIVENSSLLLEESEADLAVFLEILEESASFLSEKYKANLKVIML